MLRQRNCSRLHHQDVSLIATRVLHHHLCTQMCFPLAESCTPSHSKKRPTAENTNHLVLTYLLGSAPHCLCELRRYFLMSQASDRLVLVHLAVTQGCSGLTFAARAIARVRQHNLSRPLQWVTRHLECHRASRPKYSKRVPSLFCS